MRDKFLNGKTDWHNWMRDTMKIDPEDSKSIALVWAVIVRCDSDNGENVEALEAKLAKAVEALRFYAESIWNEDYPGGIEYPGGGLDTGEIAFKALSEIKGE